MTKKYEIIDRIIEIEIYLYIIFMFITKGESIRNILIFSAFFLWLITFKQRENNWILKKPVSLLFWGFMATIIISVAFSIEPMYSFKSLRGEPLKSVILFCIVSTSLSDKRRLYRFVNLTFFLLLFTISVGYYSYWAYDLPLMKPITSIRHAWHSRFAVDINTLLPFTFILLLLKKDGKWRLILLITIIAGILGVILSTSRGGLAGFIGMTLVWLIYFSKVKKLNLKFVLIGSLLIIVSFGISLSLSPMMKAKFIQDKANIMSLGRRTEIWSPLIAAAMQRPLLGWGYGSKLFKIDLPFKNTPYKKAPFRRDPAFRNPHNPFLRIFFHQGILGVILYVALLIVATLTFWKGTTITGFDEFTRYVLLSCTGIMVGTYFINAIVENSQLIDLSFILSIGLAARNLKE
jgi:O-antigen ligase